MANRTGQAASGLLSGAATGSPFGLPGILVGGGIGLLSGLFSKSDEEIRQERIRDYIKRLTEMKAKSLARLGEEAKKNFGRINQRTTGLIQRGQGDIARRAAGSGRTADEADFLALQGQITGQGSEAIQNTQDVYERMQRQIEDQYDQAIAGAEFEYTNIPSEPNFVDVLEGVAPAALQYTFNQQYLDKAFPSGSTSTTTGGRQEIVPTGIGDDIPYSYNPNLLPKRSTTNVGNLPTTPTGDRITDLSKKDFSIYGDQPSTEMFPIAKRYPRLRNSLWRTNYMDAYPR